MTVQPINSKTSPLYREILTTHKIRKRYPHEWVMITDAEEDEDFNVIKGEFLVHSHNREEIEQALLLYSDVKSLAIEYTVPISEDYAVIL